MANIRRSSGKRVKTIATFSSDCKQISFSTKADARRFLKKKRGQDNFGPKHAYLCGRCNGWHVTSRPTSA